MMHLVLSALIALATLVLLAYAACREAPRRPVRVRNRHANPQARPRTRR